MTTLQTLIIILTLGLYSCNEKVENTATKSEKDLSDTKVKVSTPDTTKKFDVDDYCVTNEMLLKQSEHNPFFEWRSGKTISHDKAWFANDTIKQTLIFELATDYHRFETYHIFNNDIPTDIINRMGLHEDGGELASNQQKLHDFDGFIKQATKINALYFVSIKGFRLGDRKQKAIDTYGKPDKQSTTDEFEKLEWEFVGDQFYDEKTDLKGKPLAEESFGHQIIMYFRNDKLVGQILLNDIP
jgi:hypothetical protein